jgi:hypothetical protein
MTGTCRVTTTNRALLKVTLQDITPREGISTEHTHIRAVTSVCSRLDPVNIWKIVYTYVEGDGASDASHGGKSLCSEDKGIFHRHL